MLVEIEKKMEKSMEKCIRCNQELSDHDFFYQYKAPDGYVCSNCGFFHLTENGIY